MVPQISIVFMGATLLLTVALAVLLPVFIKKKGHANLLPYFIGCGTFLLFALILEQLLHAAVLTLTSKSVTGNPWFLAIYGGLAAGIFEETGRYLAMRLLMKKHHHNPHNALMVGAGHGCFEAVSVVGVTMLNYLVYSISINAGQADAILAALPEEQKEPMRAVFTQLSEAAPYTWLLGGFERICAVLLHIALSVLVWTAVVRGKKHLLPAAIGLHAFVDGLIVIIQPHLHPVVLEIILSALVSAVVLCAYIVWKRYLKNPIDSPAPSDCPAPEQQTTGI